METKQEDKKIPEFLQSSSGQDSAVDMSYVAQNASPLKKISIAFCVFWFAFIFLYLLTNFSICFSFSFLFRYL